jgi:hypothetical protein
LGRGKEKGFRTIVLEAILGAQSLVDFDCS